MTILDCCISLKPNIFFLVVLGVVDMCHNLLNIDWTTMEIYVMSLVEITNLSGMVFGFGNLWSILLVLG